MKKYETMEEKRNIWDEIFNEDPLLVDKIIDRYTTDYNQKVKVYHAENDEPIASITSNLYEVLKVSHQLQKYANDKETIHAQMNDIHGDIGIYFDKDDISILYNSEFLNDEENDEEDNNEEA